MGVACRRNQPEVFVFMTYEEQLQDHRWILLSERIKERDFGICQYCMSSKNLQVHHKAYIKGRMAWEYAPDYLLTLCGECHEKEHDTYEIPVLEYGDRIWECGARIRQSIWALRELAKRDKKNG